MSRTAGALPRPRAAARARSLLTTGAVLLLLTAAAVLFLVPIFWMVSTSLKPNRHVFDLPIRWIPARPGRRERARRAHDAAVLPVASGRSHRRGPDRRGRPRHDLLQDLHPPRLAGAPDRRDPDLPVDLGRFRLAVPHHQRHVEGDRSARRAAVPVRRDVELSRVDGGLCDRVPAAYRAVLPVSAPDHRGRRDDRDAAVTGRPAG